MRRFALFLALASLAPADGKGGSSKEAELRKAIAGGLAELGAWGMAKKLNVEARGLADEALALDPGNAKAKELKGRATGDSAASEVEQKEWASKKAAFGKKIAPLYVDLSKQKHVADEKGWKYLSREMVPGAGHDTCWKQVLEFFKAQKKQTSRPRYGRGAGGWAPGGHATAVGLPGARSIFSRVRLMSRCMSMRAMQRSPAARRSTDCTTSQVAAPPSANQ